MTQGDFTRFGRNSIEVGYYIEMVFPLYNVRFISINDNFDSNELRGDTGGINVAFKYLISEYYSRDLSMKYKSAKYVKFKRGEYQSKVCPYGYRKGANGRMEPNPETAPNVRLMFELASKGYTPRQIAKVFFDRKIPTPGEYKAAHGFTGHDVSRCCGIWPDTTIGRILDDERYTGTYVIGKREVTEVGGHHVRMKDESQWVKIPDHHSAIISKELFEQAQVKRRHLKCPKVKTRAYALRGKVFCGECRHTMARTAKKTPAFFCRYTQVNETAPCHGLVIVETELEKLIFDAISQQVQIFMNQDRVLGTAPAGEQFGQLDRYNAKIEEIMEKKRKLLERFMLKDIVAKEYRSQKAAFDDELNQLREIHNLVQSKASQASRSTKETSVRNELANKVAKAEELTSELADTLIERVYVYPGEQIEIIWKMDGFEG